MLKKKTSFNNNIKIITLFNVLIKITNFLKQILITNILGFTILTDIFYYATAIISTPLNVIFEAITVGILPLFKKDKSISDSKKMILSLFLMLNIFLLLAMTIFILLLKPLSTLFDQSIISNTEHFNLFRTFCILLACTNGIYLFIRLSEEFYRSRESFFLAELNLFLINLFNLIILYFFLKKHILFLGFTGTLTTGLVVLVNFFYLYNKRAIIKEVKIFTKKNFNLLKFSSPLVISGSFGIVNNLIDRTFATLFPSGSLTLLTYSFLIVFNLRTLISIGFSTPLYTYIAKHTITQNKTKIQQKIKEVVLMISIIYAIAFIGFLLVGYFFLKLLFLRDTTNLAQIQMMNTMIIIYFPTIVLNTIMVICTQIFLSNNNSKFPAGVSLLTTSLNIALNFTLIKVVGIYGLPLATLIASIFNILLLNYFTFTKYKLKLVALTPFLIVSFSIVMIFFFLVGKKILLFV